MLLQMSHKQLIDGLKDGVLLLFPQVIAFSEGCFVKGMASYIDVYMCVVGPYSPGEVVIRKKKLYGGRRVEERIWAHLQGYGVFSLQL